jgi:two-component system NarL family response regulator
MIQDSNKTGTPIKVVIADDHPPLRMGLVTVVNSQPDMKVVAEAATAKDAVNVTLAQKPDVVLMDVRMPGGSGIEAISAIAAARPETRAIVLTTFDLDEDIYRALRAGAKAFLLKDSTMEQICDTIRKVHCGEKVFPPSIESKLGTRAKRESLTQRELEILQLIVQGKSNKEISSALFIAEDTVKTHLRTIFHKLDVNARTEAAIEAVRSGLVHL